MADQARIALVTGAARRVGREIALALARAGFDIAVHYGSSEQEARDVVAQIEDSGRRAQAFQANIDETSSAVELARAVTDSFGPVDVLVLSASSYPMGEVGSLAPEDLLAPLRVNLVTPFLLAQEIGLGMRMRGHGQIITLLDWSLDRPDPRYIPYQISKAGLREATFGLARALAPEVRVNGIAPGAVLLPEGTTDERQEAVRRKTLVGHLGSPGDVARAVLYLIDAEHFVTGTVLRVDGGRSLL